MILIPLDTDPDYTESIVLEGISYDFRFQYNPEETAWYLDLGRTGTDPVLTSVKVATNSDILGLFTYLTDIPPGRLFLFDLELSVGRVGRDNFNDEGRYRLVYFTETEYANLRQNILS